MRNYFALLLLPLTAFLSVGAAAAQDAPGVIKITTTPATSVPGTSSPTDNMIGTVVYNGDPSDRSLISVAPWGGGSGSITSDKPYGAGGQSVKIVTVGLYQGAKITLNQPVGLGNLATEKDRYLQLLLAFDVNPAYPVASPDDDSTQPQTTPQMGYPGMPGMNPYGPQYPQARTDSFHAGSDSLFHLAQFSPGYPGRRRNRNGPAYPGGPPPGYFPPGYPGASASPYGARTPASPRTPSDEPAVPALPLSLVHLTLGFQDGSQTDIVRPVVMTDSDTNWLKIGIPLSQLPLTAAQAQNPQLQSLTIASDDPAIVYVGRILVVTDNAPITCSISSDQDIAAGDTLDVTGKAVGGASNLKYEWDFNTQDQFESQSEGMQVSHKFTHGGDYVITLRVSDIDGIKQPAQTTFNLHVED